MPILTTWNDPTSENPIEDAFALITELHFNLSRKHINIGYAVYRSQNDYLAGRAPLTQNFLEFNDAPVAPMYGSAPVLVDGVAAVYSGVYDGEGNLIDNILISEEIPAVYGQAPEIAPGKPSFYQVLAHNSRLYGALAASAYTLMSGQYLTFENAVFLPHSGYTL